MKKLLRMMAVLLLLITLALSVAACVGGQDGENGITPHIGENGNWFIGSTDTGVKAQGKDGERGYKGDIGEDGENGTDGINGTNGIDGTDGSSAYDIYKTYFPDYHGSESQWINDLINGNLTRFAVTFDSNGGTEVDSLYNVRKGTLINEPAAPERARSEFGGWFKNSGLTDQWNFLVDAVSQDTILYAKWIPVGTQGLEYMDIGAEYVVAGIGTATDTDVVIPYEYGGKPVTGIYDTAFYGCTNLTSVTLTFSMRYINALGFAYCPALENIITDEDNPYFSSHDGVLFNKDKTALVCYPAGKTEASYIVPDGVEEIGYAAFGYSTNLTSITIPDSAADPLSAFSSCPAVTEIIAYESNPSFSSHDGVLFNKDKTILARYPMGKTGSYTIPDGVITIVGLAFAYCTNLSSVTISDGVITINAAAFAYCSNLTSVIIPNSVETIGEMAFVYCAALTEITIPNSVITMGDNVFAVCANLQTIYIQGYSERPETWSAYWKGGCNAYEHWNYSVIA